MFVYVFSWLWIQEDSVENCFCFVFIFGRFDGNLSLFDCKEEVVENIVGLVSGFEDWKEEIVNSDKFYDFVVEWFIVVEIIIDGIKESL